MINQPASMLRRFATAPLFAAAAILSCSSAGAATYTWSSATLGGLWSSAANWNPNTGAPVAGDIAVLDTVTGTTLRTVTYDTAASGTLGTLTLNQTASGTNTLDVQRNLTVTSTITLGASGGGVARLLLSTNSGTTNTSTTLTGNIVINAGGMLSQMAFNPSGTNGFGGGNITGNVTLQGGQFVADTTRSGSGSSVTTSISSTFAMTSGTLTIVNPSTAADRRLQVNVLNVTGGDVLTTATNTSLATIVLNTATSNTFNPTNFSSSAVQFSMQASSGTTTLTSNQIVNLLARGNGVKTFTSSLTGTNFGSLSLVDGGTDAAVTTFRLGSNLTLASGRNLPNSTAPTAQAAQRFDVGIDLGTYFMDLTATNAVFTPNTPYGSGTATTYWTFSGSGGRIIANGFNLSGTAGVATSVGPGVILESRSGNNGANNLSLGSGTGTLLIDPTSIFRYSGTASGATPATLTSTRSIGDVEVQSGALNVQSLSGMGSMRVTGGLLIASSSSSLPSGTGTLSVSSGAAVTVGNAIDDASFVTLSSGTGVASGAFFGFDTTSGTRSYGGALNSALGLAKSGANTLTLTASNSYTGGTLINGGVLAVADPGALASSGSIRFLAGTLQYTSGNTTDYSARFLGNSAAVQVDVNGQNVTFSSPIGTSNTGGFTRSGAGLLTLSGTGAYTTASMTLNGGTTVIDPGAGNAASLGAFKVMSNASGTAVATIASGSVAFAVPSNNYFLVGDGNAGSSGTINVTGGSTTIDLSLANSRMMIGNKAAGSMNVSGGSVTVAGGNSIYVGGDSQYAVSNATGVLTISGGTMAVTGAGSFIVGNSGTNGNANTGVVGTLNLNGGELQTIRSITTGTSGTAAGAQSGYVYFNGGILKPLTSSTAFMQGLTGAYVQNGGAFINSNNFDITIGQALLSGTGGSTGGLTKSGNGTLTLTGVSTYTGATTLSGGTLAVSGASNRLPTGTTLAFNGGNLALNGVSQTVAGLTVSDSTSATVTLGLATQSSLMTPSRFPYQCS